MRRESTSTADSHLSPSRLASAASPLQPRPAAERCTALQPASSRWSPSLRARGHVAPHLGQSFFLCGMKVAHRRSPHRACHPGLAATQRNHQMHSSEHWRQDAQKRTQDTTRRHAGEHADGVAATSPWRRGQMGRLFILGMFGSKASTMSAAAAADLAYGILHFARHPRDGNRFSPAQHPLSLSSFYAQVFRRYRLVLSMQPPVKYDGKPGVSEKVLYMHRGYSELCLINGNQCPQEKTGTRIIDRGHSRAIIKFMRAPFSDHPYRGCRFLHFIHAQWCGELIWAYPNEAATMEACLHATAHMVYFGRVHGTAERWNSNSRIRSDDSTMMSRRHR